MLKGGGPLPTGDERNGTRSSVYALVGDIGCLIAGSTPPLPSGTPANALAAVKEDSNSKDVSVKKK